MKKLILLFVFLVFVKAVWAEKIAIIDGFQPIIYRTISGEEYELNHGEEVANIIKTIHPDAEIIKFDYIAEQPKRFRLSMDLKAWQECCEAIVAEFIVKAVEEGAKIINISLKAYVGSQVLRDAIDYAWDRGVIVCWAAGNEEGEKTLFPAPDKYVEWFPNALIVGATDYKGNISKFSHTAEVYTWGEKINCEVLKIWKKYLEGKLTATEFNKLTKEAMESIELTPLGFPIDLFSGTSFATPIISGLLAEILKYKGFNEPKEAIDYLLSHTKENNDGKKILLMGDLILMYKDFGFDIDNSDISSSIKPMGYESNLPISLNYPLTDYF